MRQEKITYGMLPPHLQEKVKKNASIPVEKDSVVVSLFIFKFSPEGEDYWRAIIKEYSPYNNINDFYSIFN